MVAESVGLCECQEHINRKKRESFYTFYKLKLVCCCHLTTKTVLSVNLAQNNWRKNWLLKYEGND